MSLSAPPVSRRLVLGGAAAAGAVSLLAPAPAWAKPVKIDYPFTLGVASGDPEPTAIVLWTRLAPKPFDGGHGMQGLDEVPVRWDLSYLGTYSDDRQPTLDRLLLEPARQRPDLKFVVAGPQYPASIDWPANVERIEHCPPADHAAFYSASRFTLNVTRADMIRAGWSPSVRLFEAGACATPIVSDRWDGIGSLFAPGAEIVLADSAADVLAAIDRDAAAMGRAARARIEAAHSSDHRAAELDAHLAEAAGARRHAQARPAASEGIPA